MQSHTVSGFCPPRIHCIAAADIVRNDDWQSLFARVSSMQFDSILLAGCTLSAFDDGSADSVDTPSSLVRFAQACRKAGLTLLLDLELDRFPVTHPFHIQHEENFFLPEQDTHALPDPRFGTIAHDDRHMQLRLDTSGTQLALAYWQTQLAQWREIGVGGFRCLGIARISPSIWQTLISQAKNDENAPVFLAWTPGCTPEQLAAVSDCGFDAVFASDAWWDYRSSWLAEEHRRLSAIAPVIAAPEDPFGGRLAHRLHLDDADAAFRASRRAVLVASLVGDGMMLTEGFAQGADATLADLHRDRRWLQHPQFDLTAVIAEANQRLHHSAGTAELRQPLHMLSSPHADIALLLRQAEPFSSSPASLAIVNTDCLHEQTISAGLLRDRLGDWALPPSMQADFMHTTLAPAEVQFVELQPAAPIVVPTPAGKTAVKRAANSARIAIEQITPTVEHGRFPAKRIVGGPIHIEADIFSDGHDKLAAAVFWRAADEKTWQEVPMQPTVNDRWRATLPLQRIGRHFFAVAAWRDDFATYRDELQKKLQAGLDVSLELQEGRLLIDKTLTGQDEDSAHRNALKQLLKQLPAAKGKKKTTEAGQDIRRAAIELLLSSDTAQLMRNADVRSFFTRSDDYPLDVERRQAEFANWYELFPRSQSGAVHRHGTFDDVIRRLPAIRDMGFDTLYFPPIHPIGSKNKKGKNNSLTPADDDPGSPYAIGSADGGHDAIHPQLGTLQDFRRLLVAAAEHEMEIALDFAIQCSPDHPWLQQHPEWFAWRPDGTIRYAENPPKKYEDIVNVDFYAEEAIPDLWIALRDVVLLWVREGVRVFRVDNPHTKPLPFWEWMIGDVRSRAPDTIFLSEAFTRPKPMYRLAKVGFSQSYTYFTWRHGKQEFIDYLTELTAAQPPGGPHEFFRPHFFVNTPDINPHFLQRSGRPGHLIRAALAATLSGLWGVYSGFELCEAQAVTGKEEYLDSEKYEIRAWDWNRPGNIVREVAMLNRIRNGNPALHTHLNVRFLQASNEQILYFAKSTRHEENDERFGDNTLLIAINLDPFAAHEAAIDVPLWRLGLPDDGSVHIEELTSDAHFTWRGRQQQIRLDPQQLPFAIWRIRPA